MNDSRQITAFQSTAIIINSTIGVSLLALPKIASEKVGPGAIIVVGIAIFIFILSIFILAQLSKRFPRESIISYSQKILGKPLGKVVGFIIICFFAFVNAMVIKEFGFVMNTSLMNETPIAVTMLTMLFLIAITTRNSIITISFLHSFYLPFIVLPILFMVIIAIPDVEIRHLKPFLGNDTSFKDFIEGGATVAGLPFIPIGLYILTVIAPYMIKPKKLIQSALLGAIISGIIIILATGVTVAVFGSEEIGNSLWPMLVLTRMTELPAAILERMDIIFLVVWIISAFTTLLSGYLICIELSRHLFGLRSHRVLSYLALPVIFVLSMYPKNVPHFYETTKMLSKYYILVTLLLPLMLLLIAIIRRKGELSNGKSNS